MTVNGFPEPVNTAPSLGEVHINPITGELNLRARDYGQRDIGVTFFLERLYVPGYLTETKGAKEPLGCRWLLNVSGSLLRVGAKIWLPLGSFSREAFSLIKGSWKHDSAPDRFVLREKKDGFTLLDKRTYAQYVYDGAGHLISVSSKGRPPRIFSYKGDTLATITLSDGEKINLGFAHDRLATVTDSVGRQVAYFYSDEGLLTKVVYPNLSFVRYEYDNLGRLIRCLGQEGRQVFQLSYDEIGRLSRHITDKGEVRMYNYLESGRRTIAMEQNTFDYRTYSWNRRNQIEEIVYEDGQEEHFGYDENDRIVYRRSTDGVTTRLSYNEYGLLCRETSSVGLVYDYEYDDRGQIVSQRDNLGGREVYCYNKSGLLTEKISQLTDKEDSREIWERDLAGRILSYSHNGRLFRYVYEGMKPYPGIMEMPEGGKFYYEYDDVNRLTEIKCAAGHRYFGYNALDLISGETDPLGRRRTYHYDLSGKACGNLSAPQLHFPGYCTVPIVPNANVLAYKARRDVSITSDAKGRITQVRDVNDSPLAYFTYDIGGRLLEERHRDVSAEEFRLRRFKYDVSSNVIEEKIWLEGQRETGIRGKIQILRYEYDRQNRLVRLKDNLGATVEYTYDEISCPVMRKIRRDQAPAEVVKYVYDAMGRLTEKNDKADYAKTGKLWHKTQFMLNDEGGCAEVKLPDGGEITGDEAQKFYEKCRSELPRYRDVSGYLN